jgi:hypothetical protein
MDDIKKPEEVTQKELDTVAGGDFFATLVGKVAQSYVTLPGPTETVSSPSQSYSHDTVQTGPTPQ